MIGTTRCGLGRLLDGAPAPGRRIAVEFRSRYTAPVMLVVHEDGGVTAEEPGAPTDVRLWFDPPSLNLMLFGRLSKARAAARERRADERAEWSTADREAPLRSPAERARRRARP
jgi:hypothetical protein